MLFPFTDAFRREVADRCAAFQRRPASAATDALRHAAVAIALTEAEEPGTTALLLTRRASNMRAHRGQWALPGGRCDAGETAVDTARRELAEELGLALDAGSMLGLLDDYPTRSGYRITPVVFWAGPATALTPNPDEVAEVYRIALEEISRTDSVEFFNIPESERLGVRFHIIGHRIYAPTAAVIYQFRELLAGRDTRVADLEQPVFAWR